MKRYYLADEQGNIRFTQAGLDILGPIFEDCRIDIKKLKTRREYVMARLEVRPYFRTLKRCFTGKASEDKKSADHQLLMKIVFGNHTMEEFQRMITKHEKRSLFRVIEGGP